MRTSNDTGCDLALVQRARVAAAKDTDYMKEEKRAEALIEYATEHGVLAGFDNEHDAKAVAQAFYGRGYFGQAASDWFVAHTADFLADNNIAIVKSGSNLCGGFGKPDYTSGLIMHHKADHEATGGRQVLNTDQGLAVCFGNPPNPTVRVFSTSGSGEGIALICRALLLAIEQLPVS